MCADTDMDLFIFLCRILQSKGQDIQIILKVKQKRNAADQKYD